VPPDERRCFLAKDDPNVVTPDEPCDTGSFIAQHFITTGTPVGHGFAPSLASDCGQYPDPTGCANALTTEQRQAGYGRPPQAVVNHDGYYSFSPKPGLRFVVLDSVTDECGTLFCSEGSIDDTQFNWLEDQLTRAEQSGQYVLVFSHHTLRTMRQPFVVPDASEEPIHYGERVDRKEVPGQPQNPTGGKTLEELFCEHPSVLAHVNGHEHQNYVLRHDCSQAPNEGAPASRSRDFWEVETAAHIDWPQQARMIELVQEDDHTLSLVLTMLDHAGPANPGGAPPSDTANGQAPEEPLRIAGIGRELAYNDYQGDRGARGDRRDRNLVIRLGRPWPPQQP
jgi:hypothetical protein